MLFILTQAVQDLLDLQVDFINGLNSRIIEGSVVSGPAKVWRISYKRGGIPTERPRPLDFLDSDGPSDLLDLFCEHIHFPLLGSRPQDSLSLHNLLGLPRTPREALNLNLRSRRLGLLLELRPPTPGYHLLHRGAGLELTVVFALYFLKATVDHHRVVLVDGDVL